MDKDLFISVIESIREQQAKDIIFANGLSDLLQVDVNPYNNSLLIKTLLDVLRFHFPPVEDFCEIDHYCFFQNFGRVETEDSVLIETPLQLYERLSNRL